LPVLVSCNVQDSWRDSADRAINRAKNWRDSRNRATIAPLAENLLPNPADEGRIRQHAVDISKSVYRPLSAPGLIEPLLDEVLSKANQIADPFEQSFFVMVHLPYLQPFAYINKRTSRLAANLPLFRANLCPLTFLDVPQIAYSRATSNVGLR